LVVSVHQRAFVGTLAAGAKLERYEILAKLAAGGMATVYVARVQAVAGFERLVAIKVLHANLAHEDEFIRMFLDEARLAASIRHQNVVPTIDVSDAKEAGCGYFIVMEYIEGDHLGALMASAHKASEKLALPVVLRMVADALGGLGAAHGLCDDAGRTLNLVHRDVSPHNIMVGRDGVVRLTDFGVAKAEDRLTHTRDGQVKGKLAYMAPEQAVSGATDARSDLFSVGVILWECVTGQRLFRADTTAATLNKLLREPIAAPSSVDPTLAPLDALLAKALAREPGARFQSADEFVRAIEEIAPAVGGLASLRGVARTVKQHAAAKLKREKKLVGDALRALRPEDDIELTPDTIDELSAPSNTDISVVSASLSGSKQSGVFAHDTQPGNTWALRLRGSPDATTGSMSALSVELAALSLPPKASAAAARAPVALSFLSALNAHPLRVGITAFCVGAGVGAYYLLFPQHHPAATKSAEVAPVAAETTAKAMQGWVNGLGSDMPSVTTVNTVPSPNQHAAMPVSQAAAVGPVREPSEESVREANDDNAEAAALHKASRARVERTTRTSAVRPVRRVRRESSTVRGTGEATPVQASPGADDVIPNPYHTR
jgi:serine/threonine protein kinase